MRECGSFVALAKGARKRDELDRHLRQALPAALRDQVRLADLRNGRLVFLAPTPAWASRLRLAQAQILAAARAMGTQAHAVSVKVAPPVAAPVPEPPPRAPLSPTTAEHLKTAARSLLDPNCGICSLHWHPSPKHRIPHTKRIELPPLRPAVTSVLA